MSKPWTRDEILELARSFQPACVLAAAADLDVFRVLAEAPASAAVVARRVGGDARAAAVLLDALAALRLLDKSEDVYAVPPSVAALLGGAQRGSVLSMARHQANCLRRWARIAEAVKTGRPPERAASIRGEAADQEAFLLAMNDLAEASSASLIAGPASVPRLSERTPAGPVVKRETIWRRDSLPGWTKVSRVRATAVSRPRMPKGHFSNSCIFSLPACGA